MFSCFNFEKEWTRQKWCLIDRYHQFANLFLTINLIVFYQFLWLFQLGGRLDVSAEKFANVGRDILRIYEVDVMSAFDK